MRLGLLGRTVAALLAVGLVPLAVVPVLIGLNRQALRDQVLRSHALAARTVTTQVSALLDALRVPARALAGDPAVAADPRSPQTRNLLAGLLQAQPRIVAAVLANPEGQEYLRVQSREHAAVAQLVLASVDIDPVAAVSDTTGTPWLRISVPLPEGRGRLLLVGEARGLLEAVRPDELGEDASIAIVDRRGHVVAASPADVTLDRFPDELVSAARTGHISGASADAAAIGAYAPIPDTSWSVLSRQPAHVAEAVARRMQQRSLLAVAAALVLIAGVAAAAWQTTVQPLRSVIRAQQRLAGRETGSGDEIAQLKASFEMLEHQTLDREAMSKVFLKRYQVVEKIGAGGMGTVFRGWDPKLQRPVALKTVRLDQSARDATGGAQTLLQEAITVARFNHPNIVAIHDVEDTPEAAFIAMELVDGISLEDYQLSLGKLDARQTVLVGLAVSRALAAAHARGVLHRDIKPANVLLGRDGSIKVTDFGIAVLLESASKTSDVVFGTPGYIAPEALRGESQDGLADLFSLGVLLYECLSGEHPFPGRSNDDILKSTLRTYPTRVGLVARDTPGDVEALVMGLLEKDPRRRKPATAEAVERELDTIARARSWHWDAAALGGVKGTGETHSAPTQGTTLTAIKVQRA